MKKIICSMFLSLASITIWSCRKPYDPAITVNQGNYLVVEGLINTGNDSTLIRLSRTTKLKDTIDTLPELHATVYIEDQNNGRHNLTETGKGFYKAPPVNITGTQCRLHILTGSPQKEYVSDEIEIISTPALDSVGYTYMSNGLQFYAYTHDPNNNAKYFRWDFDETWEYQSLIQARLKYENGQVESRDASEDIYKCWITTYSKDILLGSTEALNQSVVNALPVAYVDAATNKLDLGYSMLLRQYALTKDAYQYWQQLKKNTEQLGSIFDPQPSEIKGNIHSVSDPSEPVIGYISASNVTTARVLFIHNTLPFPTGYYFPPPYANQCPDGHIPFEPRATLEDRLRRSLQSGDSTVYNFYGPPSLPSIGYLIAPSECVDCRVKVKNGNNKRPSYWPQNL